ncbi:MAG: hypothetical protein PHX83_11670 [Acidobacteriia bacterium]|nr:hypothetical protein [Terriglobia bacterium]
MPNGAQNESGNVFWVIPRVWKNILSIEPFQMGSDEQMQDVIFRFLIPDRIDTQVFLSNIMAITDSFHDLSTELLSSFQLKDDSIEQIMHSVSRSARIFAIPNTPPNYPLWFVAAYPDVLMWLSRQMSSTPELKLNSLLSTSVGSSATRNSLVGTRDSYLEPSLEFLRNLVEEFKRNTGANLEVSSDEIERLRKQTKEFSEMTGFEDNFTLISTSTTKYYLELKRNWNGCFGDEVSLLAAAGLMDAQYYVFAEKTIEIMEIVAIAKEAVSSGRIPLANFIVNLIAKESEVDFPELDRDRLHRVCLAARDLIDQVIHRESCEINLDVEVANEVRVFMQTPKLQSLRESLGIRVHN